MRALTVEELAAKMDARFDKMDARLNEVDARFDKMDTSLKEIKGSVGRLEAASKRQEELLEKVAQIVLQDHQFT